MADVTENDVVTEDAPASEDDAGSLAAALLSAGFGPDGALPEAEPEPAPEAETQDEAAAAEADQPEADEPEADEGAEDAAPEAAASEDAAAAADDTASEDTASKDTASKDTASKDTASKDTASKERAAEEADAEEEEPEEEEEEVISPFDLPGDWYVIHSYSGYENKVKANLATRTSSMHMEDRIFEVVIPMESVVEIKGGRKVEVQKKMFPGYILVRMYLDDDSWYTVRNTPGVTAFVGGGSKPTPLSRREVERFLGVKKEEEKKAPRFKPAWEVGETVRVVSGPFADFNGVIEDINVDQQKVKVLVEIFGRDTPMEMAFEDIQKQ